MKRSTTNKLNMYQSVAEVLSDNQNIWQGVPAFAGAVANFSTKLDLLRIRLAEQSSTTTGVRAEKTIKIDNLRQRILIVQRALLLHGRATGNVILQERNKTSKTALILLNFGKLAVHCVELKSDLEIYGGQLSNYGISGETVSELIPLLVSVNEINNSTRKAILKRKTVTASINDLEHDLDELLRIEMDGLVLIFQIDQPAFFKAFKNARMIIDYHHGNGNTGAPVERDDGNV